MQTKGPFIFNHSNTDYSICQGKMTDFLESMAFMSLLWSHFRRKSALRVRKFELFSAQ